MTMKDYVNLLNRECDDWMNEREKARQSLAGELFPANPIEEEEYVE